MKPYTYILVNFFAIIICFIFSFHPKIRFDRHFGAFLKASLVVALPFILWDAWFTNIGVWWFDDSYLLGPRLLGLPIEELLFFICIPFSCVYTFYCLDKFFDLSGADRAFRSLAWPAVFACLAGAVLLRDTIYPFVTLLVTCALLAYLLLVAKATWVGRASFVYLILMLGFFPVNGVLTGTGIDSPVVNYNAAHILNVRILTIPVEDIVYGYALIIANIYFFISFKTKDAT